MNLLLLILCAYLVGGIPVGLLVSRAYGIDITKVGSGNIGATNVSRALGSKGWTIVFPLDALKGFLPAMIAHWVVPNQLHGVDAQAIWFICGLFGVLGHCISPYLKFKGGKGVASAFGAGLGAAPLATLSAFAAFLVVLAISRYMAIASTVGVWAVVLFAFFYPNQSIQLEPFLILLALIVTYRHRNNFSRLREGTEPKFSLKKKGIAAVQTENVESESRAESDEVTTAALQ